MDLVGLAGGRVRPPRVDLPHVERQELKQLLAHLGVEVHGE